MIIKVMYFKLMKKKMRYIKKTIKVNIINYFLINKKIDQIIEQFY